MTLALAVVLCASLSAAPTELPAPESESSPGVHLALGPATERAASGVLLQASTAQLNEYVRVTIDDAPASPGASFLASATTSFTGFASLLGLAVGPPSGLPGSEVLWRARLAGSLLLMSVGPSMGDLLNHDTSTFLVSAVSRTAIAGLSWLAIELTAASPGSMLISGTVLLVTVAVLVWTGWCAADLVRSSFAPERWVERTNAELRSRRPIAEVTRTGPY